MFSTKKKVTAALTLTVASAFLLSACSMGSGESTTESEEPMAPESSQSSEPMEMDPAANLVGPGCAAYAEQVRAWQDEASARRLRIGIKVDDLLRQFVRKESDNVTGRALVTQTSVGQCDAEPARL